MYAAPRRFAVDRTRQAALALLFLSPAAGELVSGSSPPLEFFNPLSTTLFAALYGCGTLLIREAVLRWQKGVVSLMLLGAAYGVYEEGLTVKSWFNPGWMDLGTLGHYGRYGGVNWVWAVWLTIYHATISIALPIFLIDVLFPDLKGKRLLSDKELRWPIFAFATVGAVGFLLFPYYPGAEVLWAVVIGVALVGLAMAAPKNLFAPVAASPARSAWPFAVLGAAWMTSAFVIFGAGESFGLDPAVDIMIGLCLTAAVALLLHFKLFPGQEERFLFAFLSGCMGLFIAFGFILGFVNPWAFLGQPIAAAVAAGFLVRVHHENKSRWPSPAEATLSAPATPATA